MTEEDNRLKITWTIGSTKVIAIQTETERWNIHVKSEDMTVPTQYNIESENVISIVSDIRQSVGEETYPTDSKNN